jgi:acetyl-CoA acetyltransferase
VPVRIASAIVTAGDALAAQAVLSGTQDLIIAGGVESMLRSRGDDDRPQAGAAAPSMASAWSTLPERGLRRSSVRARRYGVTRDELLDFAVSSHTRHRAQGQSVRRDPAGWVCRRRWSASPAYHDEEFDHRTQPRWQGVFKP